MSVKRQRAVLPRTPIDQLILALRHLLLKFLPVADDVSGRCVNKLSRVVSETNTCAERKSAIAAHLLLYEYPLLLTFAELYDAAGAIRMPTWGISSGSARSDIRNEVRRLSGGRPAAMESYIKVMTTRTIDKTVFAKMTKPMMVNYLHGRVGGTKKALNMEPELLRARILTELGTVRALVDFLGEWLPIVREKVKKSVEASIAGRAKAIETKELKRRGIAKDRSQIQRVLRDVDVGMTFEIDELATGDDEAAREVRSRKVRVVRMVFKAPSSIVVETDDDQWTLRAVENLTGNPLWKSAGNPFLAISSRELLQAAASIQYDAFRAGIAGAGSGSGSAAASDSGEDD